MFDTVATPVGGQAFPFLLIPLIIVTLLMLIALWLIFVKAGKPGWAVLIPIYSLWVLYTVICDRGTAMFRLLIPFYNIYWAIKSMIKLGHAFGKNNGFGVGLIFLPLIFFCILGYGRSEYQGPQVM